jgi:orotate phosphoribosyltransferase
MMTIDRETLAAKIAEVSVLQGTFTLRSGRISSYYLDKYLFATQPEILKELAVLFSDRIPKEANRLAGAELGGIPLVSATSIETGLPCVFIRNSKKDYGTAKQLEGTLEQGDCVVLLEDVATTGGQALEAVEIMRSAGAKVLKVIATIDRLEGARENFERVGVEFESLFTKTDLGVQE